MNLIGLTINTRYRITAQRSENALCVRYAAYDDAGGTPVLVSILKGAALSNRIEDRIRFRHVVEAAAAIDHPNLVAVRETGEVIGLTYLVTELAAGITLDRLLRQGALAPEVGARVGAYVCRALEQLHRAGIVHRDLRPENVLLAAPDASEEARLSDALATGAPHIARAIAGGFITVKLDGVGLALVREYGGDLSPDEIERTFGYIAPEQTGVLKRPVDERSDLYSLGVLAYEMLAGSPPFSGGDVCALIHQHVARTPPPPSRVNHAVPAILDAIVLKLIEKEPENRYQTAAGAASDFEAVAGGAADFTPGRHDRSVRLSFRTRIVGREREIAALKRLFSQAQRGSGCVCLIGGESGSGKTRTVEELRDFVYASGGAMIDGTCAAGAGGRPYGPFREAMDSYLRAYRSYPDARAREIAARLGDEFGELGGIIIQLNPGLTDLLGAASAPVALKPNREYKRHLMTIARFLFRLSEIENGLTVLIDDLQWADDGTLDILGEIAREIGDHPLLVIGTYRNDEVADDHPLAAFLLRLREAGGPLAEMTLANLDRADMARFVASLLSSPGEPMDRLADFVHARSRGNPFFAIEIVKQLVAEGVLRYGADGWGADPDALVGVAASPSIVDIILRRIGLLDDIEKNVLSRAAVIGKRFPLDLLYRICALDRSGVVAITDRAAALQLVEPSQQVRGEMHFVHDRVHEAFSVIIDGQTRATLHQRIAEALEEERPDREGPVLFDIVRHYHAAGNADKLLEYAYPAGVRAQGEYANEDAIRYYTMALDILGEQPAPERRADRRRCLERIGEVHLTVGNNDRAIGLYQQILSETDEDAERVRAYKQISQAYFKKGDWRNCERYARRGMRILGENMPVRRAAVIASLVREAALRILHDALPAVFVRSRARDGAERDKLIIWFYVSLGWSFILSDVRKYIHSILRAYNLSESRIGPSAERAMMMTGYATILGAIPLFSRCLRLHERALRLRMSLGDTWGAAQTHQLTGFAQNWMGDYSRSIQSFERAIELFRRTGDVREIGMSTAGLIHNYALIADYASLGDCIERYRDITRSTNDVYGISEADTYRTPYLLETGDIEGALESGRRAYETSLEKQVYFTHCRACIELGRAHLEQGDPASVDAALEHLSRAASLYHANNFLKQYTVYLFTHLAEALLASFHLTAGTLDPRQRRARLRAIGVACREAERRTRRWVSHHGSALAACAQHRAACGRTTAAHTLFKAAIAELAKLGRQYELGRAMYHYGIFLMQHGDTARARELLQAAYQEFMDIGAPRYIARIRTLLGFRDDGGEASSLERFIERERLAAVMRMSQDIAGMADSDELNQAVLARALEITGAQRGLLLLSDGGSGLTVAAGHAGPDGGQPRHSPAIVDEVLARGTYYIGPSDSGSSSVLCAPIRTGSAILGACHLDNPASGDIFTDKEAHLLIAFLTRSAAAIENARLLKRIGPAGPAAEKPGAISQFSEEILKRALDYLADNYLSDISREGLAAHLQVHPDHLGKVFKKGTGKKISEHVNELRIRDAARRLVESDETIIDIAFAVGFESLRTFNRAFQKVMGTTPTEYRETEKKP
ncbi:MAG TPA: AAA family ATPase [Spirochaetota bacterium]|nr:AAA family ATPase [Spirochaetota bacterium]